MSFSCPAATWDETLQIAVRLGYNGIEPRTASGHGHGIELSLDADGRKRVRDAARQAGIAICCLSLSEKFANPEVTRKNIDATLRYLDLAGDIGAPLVRVFGGDFSEEFGRARARDQVAAAMRELAPEAANRGVKICVEAHDNWSDPQELAFLMRAIDAPNVGVLWDFMHPLRAAGSSFADTVELLAPWINHTHFHDGMLGEPLWMTPIGQGEIPHREPLRLLQKIGYKGYLSGEWIDVYMDEGVWENHLETEIAAIRRIEADLETAAN